MTLAARTREAVRARPFLHDALRAGVLNHTAAARYLDLGEGDEEAVAAALRRYGEDLPAPGEGEGAENRGDTRAAVTLQSGLERVEEDADNGGTPADVLLSVGDTALAPGEGSLTAVAARDEFDAAALGPVLRRLAVEDIEVVAVGGREGHLVVVVERRDGAAAVRHVEDALERAGE
jgi:hypothetical protein